MINSLYERFSNILALCNPNYIAIVDYEERDNYLEVRMSAIDANGNEMSEEDFDMLIPLINDAIEEIVEEEGMVMECENE